MLARGVVGGGGGGGAARYWRIYVTANNGDGFLSMNEVELRLTAGGADQASGGTASASSSYFGDNGNRAFDNNTTDVNSWVTSWAGGPEWLRYDFGAGNDKAIAEVAIWPESTTSYTRAPKDFKIQSSADGSTWTDAATYATITGWSSFGAGGGGIYRTFSVP